ncbi:protein FAM3C-like [Cynoglossus semilaevis]|uniref:protein FAM3C-like n=1 Tax=Cynoglossus semilaevis TaxID=244447 RepID=UPI00049573D1|nr:protein FAM3C-like [Cynoglossus semilaevis]XP_024912221.1 protein FAM3C-like [Cynoglossus semilaevis]XP_024912222.1 protein FAM3C-like [Cynoglossus semilaevis]
MVRRKDMNTTIRLFVCSLVAVVVFFSVLLLKRSDSLTDLPNIISESLDQAEVFIKTKVDPLACLTPRECPSDHFSFYVQSGAANIVLPKICIQNRTVLGAVPGNGGVGLNIVVMDGRTGEILKTGAFDMWGGDVQPLVDFLKAIEVGSVVLMASFDDPATKLNEEARNLIADLGSSLIQTLGFRDNWVFVGGKGESVKSNYEKTLKNEREHNKYEEWPEIIDLHGCIPQYLQ